MARFICCTRQDNKEGGGEPVWINLDLVAAVQIDQFGVGSKIVFTGENAAHFYVQEKPHEIFEKRLVEAKASSKG
ncbi:hypothetical protein LZ518_12735 [Sphingomonas sp. RB56-2]|uniref:Uncharacterized protein n=1 Tax=Sphingomonas brevis TaxID=2908206 RepID=A0ABT0SD39_9SPHN|nr:hypothetical protein [Sphingomonas brevis]MCL6741996.1 hypothetical protein [Sphingomonas brevis]